MKTPILNINCLPSIEEMKKISQGLALLDAILMPDWEYRYFSFNNNWDGEQEEMIASMKDGAGMEYFIHFTDEGVAGKVFDNQKLIDAQASLMQMPSCFSSFKNEAAFSIANATFFFWREKNGNWTASPEDLHSYALLGFLVDGVEGYHRWAEDYYERKINFQALKDVFDSLAITEDQ